MRLSEKFDVSTDVALLYDFLNSISLRRYVEEGEAHIAGDELATVAELESWLRSRGLLEFGGKLSLQDHHLALELRGAMRSFLAVAVVGGDFNAAAARLDSAASHFPLAASVSASGGVGLLPASGATTVALILAEFHLLSVTGRLNRLKICASEDCRWVFFDRSKPGNRRWCSSTLCGNRHKTRAYRQRRRVGDPSL